MRILLLLTEFDSPHVLKCEYIIVGSYASLKAIGYVFDRQVDSVKKDLILLCLYRYVNNVKYYWCDTY